MMVLITQQGMRYDKQALAGWRAQGLHCHSAALIPLHPLLLEASRQTQLACIVASAIAVEPSKAYALEIVMEMLICAETSTSDQQDRSLHHLTSLLCPGCLLKWQKDV